MGIRVLGPTLPGSGLAMGLLLVQTLSGRRDCSLQGAGADRRTIGISSSVKTKLCSLLARERKDRSLSLFQVPSLRGSLLLI